jgi:predicted lactoylglutathione lyase
MSTKIFINLPVKKLDEAITFFEKIGFEFDPQFTNENGACLIIGNNIFVMLLPREVFKTFTKKDIVDATKNSEVILAFSATSRERVNEIVTKALEIGGKTYNPPVDQGFMYGWSFEDLDGHLWEVIYMDDEIEN